MVMEMGVLENIRADIEDIRFAAKNIIDRHKQAIRQIIRR